MSSDALRLSAGDATITVDPAVGGRLVSWRVGDLELLGGVSDVAEEYGCYPMAPWPGRLRGNAVAFAGTRLQLPLTYGGWAIHGTVLAKRWDVVRDDVREVVLRTGLGEDWPWQGSVELTWSLAADQLHSSLTVESAGARFPAEVGWHPWFRRRLERGGNVAWTLDAKGVLERGDDQLPTGRILDVDFGAGPFDDAFVVPSGRALLRWPGALDLEVAAEGATWFVVYDKPAHFVCVEPQSAPPDGLGWRAGVTPGAPRRAAVTWAWSAPAH